jgi:hypothetical protein
MTNYEYARIIIEVSMAKVQPTFWVTNLSNRNVTLADLALNIPAFRSVNLLDKKHYQYTLEQLQKSADSGSIFKKSDKIKVRKTAPQVIQPNVPFLKETYIPSRERSILEIKEEKYEELEFANEDQKKKEEEYAKENAEYAQMDEVKLYTAAKG